MSELGKSPRRFSNAFKERMVLRLEAGERIAAVAEEAGVKRKHDDLARRVDPVDVERVLRQIEPDARDSG